MSAVHLLSSQAKLPQISIMNANPCIYIYANSVSAHKLSKFNDFITLYTTQKLWKYSLFYSLAC